MHYVERTKTFFLLNLVPSGLRVQINKHKSPCREVDEIIDCIIFFTSMAFISGHVGVVCRGASLDLLGQPVTS